MKLFGGARKNGNGRDGKKDRADIPPAEPEKAAGRKKAPEDTESRNRRKAKRARAILSVVLVLVILAVAAGVYYIVWVRPPEILRQRLSFLYPVEDSIPDVSLLPEITPSPTPEPTAPPEESAQPDVTASPTPEITPLPDFLPETGEEYVYTFAVFGVDVQDGYADAVMICKFDMARQRLDVASLPPDTLVNAAKDPRQLNALYADGGTDAMLAAVSEITGYTMDFYMTVEIDGFAALIDAFGGVEFEIPMDMDYEDPSQGLEIHLTAGRQLLDGDAAQKLMRFRSGYDGWNPDRIEMQHSFLRTAVSQIIAKRDSLSLSKLARVFLSHCSTDLTYGNVIWFSQQVLHMENLTVNFLTVPGYYVEDVPAVKPTGQAGTYYCIDTEKWLALLNVYFNPFEEPFEAGELSILTYDPETGEFTSTNDVIVALLDPTLVAGETTPRIVDPFVPATPGPKPSPEAQLPERQE